MEILFAQTADELGRCIDDLAINVPPRGPERTKASREQWQIHHLLRALAAVGDELHLPLHLWRRESPDFVLRTRTRRIGIENTETVNRDFVRATMHPNARQDGSVVDPSLYKWGTEGRSGRRIAEEAGRKRLSGPGWASDSVEREFAQSVVDEVHRKHLKLASYARYDSDRLLIYHNHPSPCIDIEQAVAHTRRGLADYWATFGFDTVYVHKYRWMLAFSKDVSRVFYEFPRSDAPLGFDDAAWAGLDDVEQMYLKSLEHESDFTLLRTMQNPRPALGHRLAFEGDLTDLHEEWVQARLRDLGNVGCHPLLCSRNPNRLKTATEIGLCPTALGLFPHGALRYVCVALNGTQHAAAVLARLQKTVPHFGLAKASIAAVLGYLATLDHVPHWASDAQASSRVLGALRPAR